LPLFVGLSVTPRVWVNEAPTGPNAGKILQPVPEADVAVQRPDALVAAPPPKNAEPPPSRP